MENVEFHLEGVTWGDGTPVTTEDVLFTDEVGKRTSHTHGMTQAFMPAFLF
ncbi:MAG: hypothetical protein R3F54_05185 [Alphaproteobacteria bacterium]